MTGRGPEDHSCSSMEQPSAAFSSQGTSRRFEGAGMSARKGSGPGECADQAQGLVPYIHDHWGNCVVRDQSCQKDVKKAVLESGTHLRSLISSLIVQSSFVFSSGTP